MATRKKSPRKKSPGLFKRLSKSRFMAGRQCHRLLWWTVHEPDAEELTPDPAAEVIFAQGHEVGEAARRQFRGGGLVDLPHYDIAGRVRRTQELLAAGESVLFEASFLHRGVFVAVDVLRRTKRGWQLLEVKSSTKVKEEHLPDVAVQRFVVRGAGVDVERCYLMHLNRECAFPDLTDLFARTDVTKEARAMEREVEQEASAQLKMLAGKLPKVETGDHCKEPYACPFFDRCHGEAPEHHISTLYRVTKIAREQYLAKGVESIADLDETSVRSDIHKRQVRAVASKRTVVEPTLQAALAKLPAPLAYLDFETVAFAIPRYQGGKPWHPVAAQASIHVETDGELVHHEHLATGTEDPRPELARFVIDRLRGARTILCWNASFELRCLQLIADAYPRLRVPIKGVSARIVDLLPIVRDHVYHPAFNGSFGLKSVTPALVPKLSYDKLEIAGGDDASAVLFHMLSGTLDAGASATARASLLAYCRLDTLAMVEILRVLRGLAGRSPRPSPPGARKRRARV